MRLNSTPAKITAWSSGHGQRPFFRFNADSSVEPPNAQGQCEILEDTVWVQNVQAVQSLRGACPERSRRVQTVSGLLSSPVHAESGRSMTSGTMKMKKRRAGHDAASDERLRFADQLTPTVNNLLIIDYARAAEREKSRLPANCINSRQQKLAHYSNLWS
jgi:hypothetical protein